MRDTPAAIKYAKPGKNSMDQLKISVKTREPTRGIVN